jgi:hypothetical protein
MLFTTRQGENYEKSEAARTRVGPSDYAMHLICPTGKGDQNGHDKRILGDDQRV